MSSFDPPPERDYEYTALQPGAVFRYLILQPGHGSERLRCSLVASRLDEAPAYEAISYVWGDPTLDQPIAVDDGRRLHITRSLTDVLRRLRRASEPRTLWADSICINQKDNAEKGHQVGLMASIYRGAARVLIYLGDDSDGHAAAAVQVIKGVNGRIEQACKTAQGPWAKHPELDRDDPVLRDTRWAAVAALYRAPWFGRGWTVQEACLAREGLVIWGRHETSWAKLMRVDVFVCWYAPSCVETYDGLGAPALHWQGYFAQHQDETGFFFQGERRSRLNCLGTLEAARELGLTDRRDRVYAFLELLRSEDGGTSPSATLVPNYSADFLTAYRDLAVLYLDTKHEVQLLDYVQHTEESLEAKLPSWVPRWDFSLDAGSRLYLPIWPALTDRSSSARNLPAMTETGVLRVRGVILDSVVHVSEAMPSQQHEVTSDRVVKIWKIISQLDGPPTTAYPPHCRLHAFVEALYGNLTPRDGRAWRPAQAAYLLDIHKQSGETEEIDSQYWKDVATGGDLRIYQFRVQLMLQGKAVFVTRRGLLGVAYPPVRVGDQCAIVFGCKSLSILRGAGNAYKLLGGTYVVGTTLQMDERKHRGFTMLGSSESKDWTKWDCAEADIDLC
jgi:hypothetical protein